MLLSVLERVILGQILPSESNFATLRIVRDLRGQLSFSEAELAEFSIKQAGEQLTWDPASAEKEIEIGERATDLIVESLKKLNDEKKLSEQHFSLYEKFVAKPTGE